MKVDRRQRFSERVCAIAEMLFNTNVENVILASDVLQNRVRRQMLSLEFARIRCSQPSHYERSVG
jgi:hypothetical protein